MDDNQYSDLLANCLSLIYLAKDEDFGMGVLEAMKYKKGPIVYNSGNLKYFVKDKFNGRILNRLNSSGLENIIHSTTREKFIYYGKNAFQFAKKNYPNAEWKCSDKLARETDYLFISGTLNISGGSAATQGDATALAIALG